MNNGTGGGGGGDFSQLARVASYDGETSVLIPLGAGGGSCHPDEQIQRLQAEHEALRSALAQLIVAVRHLKPCPGTLDIAEKVLKGTNPLFPSSAKESK